MAIKSVSAPFSDLGELPPLSMGASEKAVSDLDLQALPWLHIEGQNIVDKEGNKVVLRGMNLGGHLVEEMWMMPFEGNPPQVKGKDTAKFKPIIDHVSLWETVETRLGKKEMLEIRNAFRSAWIEDSDFERIKAAGFNTVRLPFIHDLTKEPEGLFYWIDWTIEKAQKFGMYVILDLHGTPGRQSEEQHTGQEKCCKLFSDFTQVEETVKLWTQIAGRYKDYSAIAGYDLMNEPMGGPNHAWLYVIYEKLYQAIRRVDKDHIIFMEDGFKGFEYIPTPSHVGWKNVSLSMHMYPPRKLTDQSQNSSGDACFKHFQTEIAKFSRLQKERQVPFYVGEFNVDGAGNHQTVHKILSLFEEHGMSWSFWMYKIITNHEHRVSMWGLYSAKKSITKINPFVDSKEEMLKKIKNLKTDNFDENKPLTEVFQLVSRGIKPVKEPELVVIPEKKPAVIIEEQPVVIAAKKLRKVSWCKCVIL